MELNWVRAPGAEDCASGTVIAEDIARRLGRDPFAVSSDDALRIDGIVDGDPRRARIFVRHPDGSLAGTRDLTADADAGDCHALDQAVALAIALVIDPEASLTAPPDAVPADAGPATIPAMPMDAAPIDTVPIDGAPVDGAPTEPADAVAEDATSSTDVSTVEPDEAPMVDDDGIDPAPTTTALDASAWFFLAEGVLPKGATGVGLEVIGPIDGTFDLHIALRYFPEVRTPAPDDTFAFGLTTGHLGACLRAMRIETDGIGLAACASMELGALHAVVFEPAPKQPGDRLWLSGLLGARLLAPLYGALGIELALEMVAPITRDRFTVEGRAAPAFQQSVIGGIAGLGLRLTP